MRRKVKVSRDTNETQIQVELDLDGSGKTVISIGLPFFEHMLDQLGRHSLMDLKIVGTGDLQIDGHHTVEDCGIIIGQAIKEALGDKSQINRFGSAYVPLDESLTRSVIDFSGRPGLFYSVNFARARVGDFDLDLIKEFFQGLANHIPATIHIDNLKGENAHHIAESVFKSFAKAIGIAISINPNIKGIPSTKGTL